MDRMSRRTLPPLPDDDWVLAWIKWYGANRKRYVKLAKVLQDVLQEAANRYAPLAIVQTRPKDLASYAGKIQRKVQRYRQTDSQGCLLHPITYRCGARVITHTLDQVKSVCRFIEDHFEIGPENSLDVATRLNANEFGYLSVHYIVRFKPGMFPTRDISVRHARTMCDLTAEIQVRTLLEHAWADMSHELAYKGTFSVPKKWDREFARLAAILENVDEAFCRADKGLSAYAANYGAYMPREEMLSEIAKARVVLQFDPENVEAAHRIARLAMCLGDWTQVIKTLKPLTGLQRPAILRDLGVAMCKQYKTGGRNFLQGQEYLNRAVQLDPTDSDAIASLGGTWRGIDNNKALDYYRQAFEVNPTDPYPLGNYLEFEIAKRRNLRAVSPAMPSLKAAVRKCRDQADVGMNIPWAFYDTGKFNLLLQKPYDSLVAYAKAVCDSTHVGMVETALKSVKRLKVVRQEIPGFEWMRRFLSVAIAGRFTRSRLPDRFKKLATKVSRTHKALEGPIVILTGGCDGMPAMRMTSYRKIVTTAFADFKGTIISGGTKSGIGRLAGDVGQARRGEIRTVGYLPANTAADSDRHRYHDIRRTDGTRFSPLEAIQAWIDIIDAGLSVSDITILGIGGGVVSEAEYRMALALGARVGVIGDSGGAVSDLLTDADWCESPSLFQLPADPMTIRAFVSPRVPAMRADIRATIARAIHDCYRENQSKTAVSEDPSLSQWDKLPSHLRDSNHHQADHIEAKLALVGCTIDKAGAPGRARKKFTNREVEFLSEMEHGRWNNERIFDGWMLGETKDIEKKISPYLVPWDQLPEEIKEYDRQAVRGMPDFLASAGLEIRKKT